MLSAAKGDKIDRVVEPVHIHPVLDEGIAVIPDRSLIHKKPGRHLSEAVYPNTRPNSKDQKQ